MKLLFLLILVLLSGCFDSGYQSSYIISDNKEEKVAPVEEKEKR